MSTHPEGNAIPDDQGKLGFCTRYALGKAIANGFMDKDFVKNRELDFDQNVISGILVNNEKANTNMKKSAICLLYISKEKVRMWPTEFDGKTLRLQEHVTKDWWNVKVGVTSVSHDMNGDNTPQKRVLSKFYILNKIQGVPKKSVISV